MFRFAQWAHAVAVILAMATVMRPCSAQAPDSFRWIDFHSPKDQDVVIWVSRALDGQSWTAIREIGVQYDAALVITTLRATPQSAANQDTYSIWSVSLTNRAVSSILKGVNLRLMDWMLFVSGEPRELGALYDDCNGCAATTYFTALHYDLREHTWAARWMRGAGAIPLWSENPPPDVTKTQVTAAIADPNGRETIGTWNHLDYGKQKQPEDFVYRYDVDPMSSIERTQLLVGKEAAAMKERLCHLEAAVPGLSRGQESALCQQGQKARWERKPATTPPANNQGQSRPPGAQ
jgi:hypothetical protein